MEATPSVLLLDDGELQPIVSVLDTLGCNYVRIRGGSLDTNISLPRDLILATARRAMAHLAPPPPDSSRPVRVAISSEDCTTLRTQLRLLGFEYLIRQPLHIEALERLLVRILSYSGTERRRSSRHALRCEVRLQTSKRNDHAMLTEISRHGCLISCAREIPPGMHVELTLPQSATRGNAIPLHGQVVRVLRDEAVEVWNAAVEFEALEHTVAASLEELLWLLERTHETERKPQEIEAEELDLERRSVARRSFGNEILSAIDETRRTLIGKDLSLGGMRVEPRPELVPGKALRVALFGPETDETLMLAAHVARNDGSTGVALLFDPMSPEAKRKLEALIIGMPAIEALQDGESDALGTVLTEIVFEPRPTNAPKSPAGIRSAHKKSS